MSPKRLLLIPAVLLIACTFEMTAPFRSVDGLPPGLEVEFVVDPGEVSAHDPFTATLTLTNTRSDTLEVVTGNGCLVNLSISRDGEWVPFQGGGPWGCLTVVTTHTFPPGETRTMTWDIRAEISEFMGEEAGAPVEPGTYLVQVEFDTVTRDRSGRKPTLEAELVVR